MKAERETFDRLIAHFLADRIGATFDGHISGVTRAGLFVKLDDTGADGFIPARTIGNDYFRYHEDRHALIGDRSGETYRLGDRVTVRLVEAAPVAGALRFELLSEGRYKAPDRGGRGRAASAQAARARRKPSRGTRARQETTPMNDGDRDRIERMNRFVKRMNEVERDLSSPNVRPKDAATLILVDRSGAVPKVLLGKRHAAAQIHAGQVRVSRRRRRPDRPAHAGSRPLDPARRSAADEAVAAAERGAGARAWRSPRSARHSRRPACCSAAQRRRPRKLRTAPWSAFAQAGFYPDLSQPAFHRAARSLRPAGRGASTRASSPSMQARSRIASRA